jgi:AraC-like DNA-binding protein
VPDQPATEQTTPKVLNRVDIWRPREFDGIELHRGFDVTLDYPRHWHEEIYLCAVLEGTNYLECGGKSILTPRGTLAVVPPGEVHANQKSGCTFRCIFIGHRELQQAAEQFMEQRVRPLHFRPQLVDEARTTIEFLRLHRSLEEAPAGLSQDESLLVFLHEFVVRHGAAKIPLSREGNEDLAVRRTKRFLEEHYARPVRLQELARLTGLSPYRLNRSFCRKIGMPPHAYQLQVRIARAKSFLEEGRPAAQIALLTGFFDQSHFTHSFRRSAGMTPRQYLRCCKNLQDGKTHTEYVAAC